MEDNKDKIISDIFSRFNDLYSRRSQWEDTWDDIIYWTNPSYKYVQSEDTEKGDINTEHIYDNSADVYLDRLSATLNSMLTGQFSKWFMLKTDDDAFNEDSAGKEWLDTLSEVLLDTFTKSNFYVEVPKYYYDLCSLGTATMYIESDDDQNKHVRFSTRHIRESYLAENKYGDIDTIFRKVKMTARQVVQRWGKDAVSDKCYEKYEKNPDSEVEILHCVYPREDYDMDKRNKTNMPYTSYWFEYDGRHMIDEGGYEELPYTVARWSVSTGEIYGRGPMHLALPNVKSLNRMMQITIEGSELAIKPPLKGTPDLTDYQDSIDLEAGKVVIFDPTRQGELTPIWDFRNANLSFEMMNTFRDQIADALLGTQLQTIDNRNMTAEEVRARVNENAKVIGPTFGRIQAEFLDKIINRVYNILLTKVDANGEPIIPVPPIEPEGELRIEFVSPLAKAQRGAEIQGIITTINWAMSIAQAKLEILDNIDFDEALRIFSEVSDAPPSIIVDNRVVAQQRQLRAMQQQAIMQQQMQAQQSEQQAKQVKDVADAGKSAAEARQIREE